MIMSFRPSSTGTSKIWESDTPISNRVHRGSIANSSVHTDLARLGNLFKVAMDDKELRLPESMNLEPLCNRIRNTPSILKTKIEELQSLQICKVQGNSLQYTSFYSLL